jgi:CheY-like chemotaxis protein
VTQRVLLIGDCSDVCFAPLLTWLHEHSELHQVSTSAAAAEFCRSGRPPQWIGWAQARRGEFNSAEIERLHQTMPLVRMFTALGSWCEGELRTGSPWPGVPRLYWYDVAGWLERQWSHSLFAPRTVTVAERALLETRAGLSKFSGHIVIESPNHAGFASLQTILESQGGTCHWAHRRIPIESPDLLLWDCPRWPGAEALKSIRQRFALLADSPDPRWGALIGWPRWDEYQAAEQAGAAFVIAKPFSLDHLVSAVGDAIAARDAAA